MEAVSRTPPEKDPQANSRAISRKMMQLGQGKVAVLNPKSTEKVKS